MIADFFAMLTQFEFHILNLAAHARAFRRLFSFPCFSTEKKSS
jgi:hypothetical protein